MVPAIVIPVHNALLSVDSLLNTIDEITPATDIVLVDDASQPEVSERLQLFRGWRSSTARTEYLRNDRQQLFTRTANRGIRYAVNIWNAESVVVLNTDCTLREGWLPALLAALENPRVGIAGYWDNNFPAVDLQREPVTEMKQPGYITGHCFVMRTAMLKEIGVLCETDTTGRQDRALAPFHGQAHIGSERILCWRANSYGWKTVYVNAPLVEHGDGKSWGRDLRWLSQFILEPLWSATDTLAEPKWLDG